MGADDVGHDGSMDESKGDIEPGVCMPVWAESLPS
jgi:hypothetical protein